MDDLRFYIFLIAFQSQSMLDNIIGTLFRVGKIFSLQEMWGEGAGESNQGWITCNFTSFSTVFRSYQDDEGMMMKGCVRSGTPFMVMKIST